MLEQLTVRNFQKHKHKVIDLDPYVTVFVGPTGAGKTALLRALRWLCLNKGDWEAFLSHDATTVISRLKVDGHTITRKNCKSGNIYELDGTELRAFGRGGVPDPVADVLNVDETNFQQQLDSPFWFMETAGEVSKELNKIVNLSLIDKVLFNLAAQVRKSKGVLELTFDRFQTAKAKRDHLSWVVELDHKLKEIEKLQVELTEKREKHVLLAGKLKEVSNLTLTYRNAVETVSVTIKRLRLAEKWKDLDKQTKNLSSLLEKIEHYQRLVQISLPTKQIDELTKCKKKLGIIVNKCKGLRDLLKQITTTQVLLCQIEKRLTHNTNQLAEYTQWKCPVCGQQM